ncbi:hypothetical protein COCSUDRAFT_32549 [Coccomyxa subellipsoidea C-169]|uniref:Uncharacterized protein n=1 Tax=Coccomyxa subellipsoidea (strain C-169) TaxID=574566 RepID=I0Z345_COCSC|nr:hypothetical protein COCSUDRAFT_32549 [Coccomyxa subellipsoidea C-169]EIE25064.1 hypothetical protein COCSUDRAFT_32549 [Coccomyxa subellipsoidea C-169]|eukprot:XP_005649608.1 hypothetical protein COCSUDRAFT_32549 [Coccomyxa subellipsoidea C-169]
MAYFSLKNIHSPQASPSKCQHRALPEKRDNLAPYSAGRPTYVTHTQCRVFDGVPRQQDIIGDKSHC